MSDTTTITPEAKAILRDMQGCAMGWEPGTRLLGNSRAGEIYTAIDQVLTALEAAEARAEKAEDYAEKLVYAVTDGNLSNSYDVQVVADEVSRIWQSYTNQKVAAVRAEAEAENARLRAERDWLAENVEGRPCDYDSCPFGLPRPTGPDYGCGKTHVQCWQKALTPRRAAAAGEG